jgi:hypothetical protein
MPPTLFEPEELLQAYHQSFRRGPLAIKQAACPSLFAQRKSCHGFHRGATARRAAFAATRRSMRRSQADSDWLLMQLWSRGCTETRHR